MLGKVLKKTPNVKQLQKVIQLKFGRGGPYNPNRYKDYFVPRTLPKNEEIVQYVQSIHSIPNSPVRNQRHINPVRESGPLPSHQGPHTMEDIREIFQNTAVGRDFHYCQMDPEEIMRRVPGIQRKEAEFITKLGLNPAEQVDFAYIAHNIGLDVYYFANQVFVARQVVTNSKGEKTEVLWNYQAYEDLCQLNVGYAPVMEFVDYHWELFLWGDPPIKPINDFDLNVPNTWFEYESEMWMTECIMEDQMVPPTEIIPYGTPKNPHCNAELWKSQENYQEILDLEDPNWYPKNTKYNIYNQPDFKIQNSESKNNDDVRI